MSPRLNETMSPFTATAATAWHFILMSELDVERPPKIHQHWNEISKQWLFGLDIVGFVSHWFLFRDCLLI